MERISEEDGCGSGDEGRGKSGIDRRRMEGMEKHTFGLRTSAELLRS